MSLPFYNYEKHVSLKTRTWVRRGGIVDVWITPVTIDELIDVSKILYSQCSNFVIIGHTSNTYFKDSFNIEYLIDTKKLKHFSVQDKYTLMCECGVPMSKISRYCVENGISGYEGMVNLPGTVGGAIYGNAGCYGCEISKVLKYVEFLTEKGEIIILKNESMNFSFRNSVLKCGDLSGIILRAYFDISNRRDSELLRKKADENNIDRKRNQDPPSHNLGTTVNFSTLKKNRRNMFIRAIVKLFKVLYFDDNQCYQIRKFLLCFFYNKLIALPYISNKRMGCFIWKDEFADKAFPDYLELMENAYTNTSVEIEIRS